MKDANQVRDVQFEPHFQRKKRLEGPATTLSSDFTNLNKINEDYILLGKNDKFQDNIKYKCRPVKPVNTQASTNVYSQTQKSPQAKSQAVNEYILLGNNSKFANNVVYMPKSFPEVVIVDDKNKENVSNDDDDTASQKKKSHEEMCSTSSPVDDEYVLLGNNAKFSDNIVYKPKMWREFIPSHEKGKENVPAEDTKDFPVQAKKLEPAPVIDTSKFREPPQKWKKAVEKADESEIIIKKKKKSSAIQEGSKEELRLPLDDLPSWSEATDEKIAHEKESKNVFKEAKQGTPRSEDVSAGKSVKFQSPPPAPRPSKTSNIQQNNDQKLLALLHKAGIQLPPRPTVDQSEYQKNFTWKKPLPNSGTAAENKKLFQSVTVFHTDPSYQDPIPKITEYQRNFKPWIPLPTKPASPSAADEKAVEPSVLNRQKEAKHHGSKLSRHEQISNAEPSGCFSPQVCGTDEGKESNEDEPDIGMVASEICSDKKADNSKRENNVKSTQSFESFSNPPEKTKPLKHRESQCHNSEYRANFKPPSKYDYMINAWDSASSLNENMLPLESDNSGKGDWYSEVLDLRRKAAEYRRRAQNTHFCADHMAQLLSDETQLWEHASSDTPTPTDNYIRPAGITYNKYYLQHPPTAHNMQLPNDTEPEPQMTLEDVADDADVASVHSEPEADAKTEVVPTESLQEINDEASLQTGEDARESLMSPVGRVSTPVLQGQNIQRHHLDRTTPTKGGLLISSPDTKKIDLENTIASNNAEPVDTAESHHYSASDVEMKPKHCVKTCVLPSKSNSTPTFGKPSKDTHILRDQKNLSTFANALPKESFAQTSQQILNRNTNNVTMRSGNKRPKKSHPAGININQPIPETMTSTYTVSPERMYAAKCKPKEKDDLNQDFLSQSLESNSSLASEILERTRKRLNFW